MASTGPVVSAVRTDNTSALEDIGRVADAINGVGNAASRASEMTKEQAKQMGAALKALGVRTEADTQKRIEGVKNHIKTLEDLHAAGRLTANDLATAMASANEKIAVLTRSLGQDTRTGAEKAMDALKGLGVTSAKAAQESIDALKKQGQELDALRAAGDLTAEDYDKAMNTVRQRIEAVNRSMGVDTRTAAEKAADALKALGVATEASSQQAMAGLNAQKQELEQLKNSGQITAKEYAQAMESVEKRIQQLNNTLGVDTRTASEKAADALKALGVSSESAAQQSIAALNAQAQELGQLRAAGTITAKEYAEAMAAVEKRIKQANEALGNDTRTAAEKASDALKNLGVVSRQSSQDAIAALNQQAQELTAMRAAGNLTAEDYEAAMEAVKKKIEQVNQTLGNDTRTAAQKAQDALKALGVTSAQASQEALQGLNQQAAALTAMRQAGNLTADEYDAAMAAVQKRIDQVNQSMGVDTRTAAQKAADALKALGVTSESAARGTIQSLNDQAAALGQMRQAGQITAAEYEKAMEAIQQRIRQVNNTLGNDTRTDAEKAADALKALGVVTRESAQESIQALNKQGQELAQLRNAGTITAEAYDAAMKEIQQRINQVNQSLGVDTRTNAEKAADALRSLGVSGEAAAQDAIAALNRQQQELAALSQAGEITANDYAAAMRTVQQRLDQANRALGRDTRTASEQAQDAMRELGVTSNSVADEQIADLNRQIRKLQDFRDSGQITAEEYERAFEAANRRIAQANQRAGRQQTNALDQVDAAMRALGVTSERVASQQIADINRHVQELEQLRNAGHITAADYTRAFDRAQEQVREINRRMENNTEGTFDRMGRAARQFGTRMTQVGKNMALAGFATGTAWLGSGAAATKSAADHGLELRRAATAAGVDVNNDAALREFQVYAHAMLAKVGVDMGAFGDMQKDVNDKLGDFIETGAGHMVDFAEQVAPMLGVKKDQFKSKADGMSEAELKALAKRRGKEVDEVKEEMDLEADKKWRKAVVDLIKGDTAIETLTNLVNALEKTGVGADAGKRAFYMEGFASELTLAYDLFKESGKEMQELGEQGAAGFVDAEQLQKLGELNNQLAAVAAGFRGVGVALMDAGVFEMITSLTSGLSKLFSWITENVSPAFVKMGVVFGIVAAIVAPLIIVFGLLTFAFGAVAGAIGMGVGVIIGIVAAISAVISIVVAFWDKIVGLWNWFRGVKEDTKAELDSDINMTKELKVVAEQSRAPANTGPQTPININLESGTYEGLMDPNIAAALVNDQTITNNLRKTGQPRTFK